MPLSVSAIIPAGGSGLRMGLRTPKQFCELRGTPILALTLKPFHETDAVHSIIVVLPSECIDIGKRIVDRYGFHKVKAIVAGGTERMDSVWRGIVALPPETEYVVVHDGVRPFVTPDIIEKCLTKAMEAGAAIAAMPLTDTVKRVGADGLVFRTEDRNSLWQAQTPQAAKLSMLKSAYGKVSDQKATFTDEASILEHAGFPVAVVQGSRANIKITHPEDLNLAEAIMNDREAPSPPLIRIGHGYDAHRLAEKRPLILGGIAIPYHLGLLGHSDADVLVHALCDALLGAIGEGDLGRHFPDSDELYKNIDSTKLLWRVVSMMVQKNFRLANADITVVAQQPKLAPFVRAMAEKVAHICMVPAENINIKATTTEKMGFTGREEGIAAHAVVLLHAARLACDLPAT